MHGTNSHSKLKTTNLCSTKNPFTMKKNQFPLLALTFLSGIILGVSALGLFAFTGAAPAPAPASGINKISVQQANALFKNYINSATASNAVFKAFTLNKDELSALNKLAGENPSLTGFRIYMGTDNTAGRVGIVVGVNSTGADVINSIYSSDAGASGPCPPICDSSSPIMMQ